MLNVVFLVVVVVCLFFGRGKRVWVRVNIFVFLNTYSKSKIKQNEAQSARAE